jgi:hypothetical protein
MLRAEEPPHVVQLAPLQAIVQALEATARASIVLLHQHCD